MSLLQIYSTKNSHECLIIPIFINNHKTNALVDGAASSCFIDKDFAHQLNFPLRRKVKPEEVRVIDGRFLDPILFETVHLQMSFANLDHSEFMTFNVIYSPHFPVILGLSWLKLHNPVIDWSNMSLKFMKNKVATHLHNISAVNSDSCHDSISEDVSAQPSKISKSKQLLRHFRLGHRNHQDVAKLRTKKLVDHMGLDDISTEPQFGSYPAIDLNCEACALGKAKRNPFPRLRKLRRYDISERIVFDTCGPLPVCSVNGERYFITFSDDQSRFKFTFFLKNKSEALTSFKLFKLRLEKRTSKQIKILYGDNANEFLSKDFQKFLLDQGITWQSTVSHSSEQNGIAERGHLTLMDSARSMMIRACLPKQFWGPAILTATHLHNICPHPNISDTTPHEQLLGSKPDAKIFEFLAVMISLSFIIERSWTLLQKNSFSLDTLIIRKVCSFRSVYEHGKCSSRCGIPRKFFFSLIAIRSIE